MNCLLSPTTTIELSKYDSYAEILPSDDAYATAPMTVVKYPETQPLDEEEVYHAFELAISGRQENLQQKLQMLPQTLLNDARKSPTSNTIFVQSHALAGKVNWRCILLFGAFAFIFLLLGFDAMGLLVLCAR